jgi:thiamine kinase-like enzyme
LRINKAADDTAGLAISERMNNQVRGMQQANRNVQQGNNLLQTAESDDGQEDLLAAYLELGALVCAHSVAARVVTTHGDFHHGNIHNAAGGLLCVDFEGTCVSQAVQDLAYHFCGDGTKGSKS